MDIRLCDASDQTLSSRAQAESQRDEDNSRDLHLNSPRHPECWPSCARATRTNRRTPTSPNRCSMNDDAHVGTAASAVRSSPSRNQQSQCSRVPNVSRSVRNVGLPCSSHFVIANRSQPLVEQHTDSVTEPGAWKWSSFRHCSQREIGIAEIESERTARDRKRQTNGGLALIFLNLGYVKSGRKPRAG
jgi:hypothetical protein